MIETKVCSKCKRELTWVCQTCHAELDNERRLQENG